MSISTISPKQLSELKSTGAPVELIDVRTPVEFREVHVGFANNVPLDQLNPTQFANRNGNPLYVICRSGSRGNQACEKLVAAGCANVFNVEGGTSAWDQAGLPVVRGQKAISLERQVRIAAGLLVLTGAVLSFYHPYWAGLSGFVGAGLVFAGVTDTCGMGLMLAKMPWNRVPAPAKSQSPGGSCSTSQGSCCG